MFVWIEKEILKLIVKRGLVFLIFDGLKKYINKKSIKKEYKK